MNTLWAFGNSFTFGHGCRKDGPLSEYYFEYKKEEDDIWSNHLGKMLNLEVKNFGTCGASNDFIIDCIIDQFKGIKENDFVIIEITFHSRFDVPIKNKKSLSTNYWENIDLKNFAPDEREEMETIINFQYHFANNKLYEERHLKRFDFIYNRLKEKGVNVFIWNVMDFSQSDEFEKIFKATNGNLKDWHFSFKGHKDFADKMHQTINTSKLF